MDRAGLELFRIEPAPDGGAAMKITEDVRKYAAEQAGRL
jgi:hypothetical protein